MIILTGFQLRAARKVLKLTLDQLSENTDVSKVTIMRLEKTIDNLEELSCSVKDMKSFVEYFQKNKLLFPNNNTIELDEKIEPKDVHTNLTRFQLAVARISLNMTTNELYKNTKISSSSIQKYEKKNNTNYIKTYGNIIRNLISFFNKNEISFPTNLSVSIIK